MKHVSGDQISEEQLHAYVDGHLSGDGLHAVETHLAQHPDDAARVAAWRTQNDALHRCFDAVLDEPHALHAQAPRAINWRRWGALAASLVLGVVIGSTAGFVVRDATAPTDTRRTTTLVQQAALAHAAYMPEVRHPVEVGAREEQHLVAWLSKRLSAPLKAPVLTEAGYQLLGGRLLPSAEQTGTTAPVPVALLMYENAQGKRLSLLVRRELAATTGQTRDTAFRFSQSGATNVFYWIDGPLGYALAGEISRDELALVARLAYQQLNE